VERFVYESKEYKTFLEEHPHEHGEKKFLESIAEKGMTAVDVGGNSGMAACAISRAVGETGKVYCFEPIPEFREVLEENLNHNTLKNVEVVPAAVGKEPGTTHFHVDGTGTSIVPHGEGHEKMTASVVCLDEFFAERDLPGLDLLNMDCEGSELFVLQGARRLLSANRTKVFVETHHDLLKTLGQSARMIVDFLHELGYTVSSVTLADLNMGEDWESCEYLFAQR